MTQAVLREVYLQVFKLNADAFRGGEESYNDRKGQAKGLNWLLGQLETMEAEILGMGTAEEDDE